ncbi:MAG: anti-sigma factor antagonist [Mogibacterium sp.]|nr:anti-sigma factor antagonist [Mogibacterium sp.]
MKAKEENGFLMVELAGRIDSGNSAETEKEINELIAAHPGAKVVFDAEDLEYISSAGLRVLLHVRKGNPSLKIINVRNDVYEVFEMTGFSQMIDIEKAFRKVSIEGCEMIGRGANGAVYRIDNDTVVKVYYDPDAFDDIQNEREVARLALILGVPTAISYEIVRVGEGYGSVFELLNAESFAKILAEKPDKFEWCLEEFTKMLKIIHGTEVPEGKLPDMREMMCERAMLTSRDLPHEQAVKLRRLFDEIPFNNHMVHGDYHSKNLELAGDEVLLIDMDTLSVGDPIFELGFIYNAYVGFYDVDPDSVLEFQGYDYETTIRFWKEFLPKYLETDDEEYIRKVEDMARVVGYTRLVGMLINKGIQDEPDHRKEYECWKAKLAEALERTDSLMLGQVFAKPDAPAGAAEEIEVEASVDKLPEVLGFIDGHLEAAGCPLKAMMQIDVAAEEIFVNIANYAYAPDKGKAIIRVELGGDPPGVVITFIDWGMHYDPLAKEDPDVTLSAEERKIGGLGVFLVKNTMDDITYNYEDGKNILTLKKNF